MAKLTIIPLNPDGSRLSDFDIIECEYSPPELSFTKASQFAEVAIPGLSQPILQFVRGDAETITLDLFFDGTTLSKDLKPVNVRSEVDYLAKLAVVRGATHMPPLVRVQWGKGFPGGYIAHVEQSKTSFDAVVLSVTRKYTLFDTEGTPLRATVSLSLKRHATLADQIKEINFQSSDHTRLHLVTEGETLPLIAHDAFGDARLWRVIAEHNNIADARDIAPGMRLELPPLVS